MLDKPFRHPRCRRRQILKEAIASGKGEVRYPIRWGKDPRSEHEQHLPSSTSKQPVVLMTPPKQIKAFPMMRLNDPEHRRAPGPTVAAMDVLVPHVGEIIGGSQREERLDKLDSRINEDGASKSRNTGGTGICVATELSRTQVSARLRTR